MIILDDHPLVRQGIRMIVSASPLVQVVGEAGSTLEALALLQQLEPDLALIDVNLGSENGLQLIRKARQTGAACKFMLLTSSITRSELQEAKALQVEGICLKEAFPEDLIYAVEVVARGRKYYDANLMNTFMEEPASSTKAPLDDLTPKELEVLCALGKGRSNKEIAGDLYITEFTVKKHVSQILAKLEFADRTQAALYALSKGLVEFELQR
ncbi:response regulator transcription factor [Paenibacillus oryzisoli]|uniref:response regulator n=1 Tax=Paenibacillus oryzisoli TaxID=1850517 RepID=UPI003D2A57FC